jgi:hypothetical protein
MIGNFCNGLSENAKTNIRDTVTILCCCTTCVALSSGLVPVFTPCIATSAVSTPINLVYINFIAHSVTIFGNLVSAAFMLGLCTDGLNDTPNEREPAQTFCGTCFCASFLQLGFVTTHLNTPTGLSVLYAANAAACLPALGAGAVGAGLVIGLSKIFTSPAGEAQPLRANTATVQVPVPLAAPTTETFVQECPYSVNERQHAVEAHEQAKAATETIFQL